MKEFKEQSKGRNDAAHMELLILAIVIGLLPAAIAQSKGRNFVAWWIYGAALFIVALPHSLIIKAEGTPGQLGARSNGSNYRCPQCYTPVQLDTLRCPGCGGLFKAGMTKKCPDCAESVKFEARKCRFCGYHFTDTTEPPVAMEPSGVDRRDLPPVPRGTPQNRPVGVTSKPAS